MDACLVVNASQLSACSHTCHLLRHSNHNAMLSYVFLAQRRNRHVKYVDLGLVGVQQNNPSASLYTGSEMHISKNVLICKAWFLACYQAQDPVSDSLCFHAGCVQLRHAWRWSHVCVCNCRLEVGRKVLSASDRGSRAGLVGILKKSTHTGHNHHLHVFQPK